MWFRHAFAVKNETEEMQGVFNEVINLPASFVPFTLLIAHYIYIE